MPLCLLDRSADPLEGLTKIDGLGQGSEPIADRGLVGGIASVRRDVRLAHRKPCRERLAVERPHERHRPCRVRADVEHRVVVGEHDRGRGLALREERAAPGSALETSRRRPSITSSVERASAGRSTTFQVSQGARAQATSVGLGSAGSDDASGGRARGPGEGAAVGLGSAGSDDTRASGPLRSTQITPVGPTALSTMSR